MAKPTTVKIRLNSTADTGFFYVTKKNTRTMTEKMEEIRPDRAQARRVQGSEDQVVFPVDRSLERAPERGAFLFSGKTVEFRL